MNRVISVDEVISISEAMKKQIKALLDAYLSLLPIVEDEHKAIKERNLPLLQEVADQKITISQSIETHFSELKEQILRLKDRYELLCEQKWEKQLGINEGILLLSSLNDGLESTQHQKQTLDKMLDELRSVSGDFRNTFDKIQPDLERNRVVINTMLEDNRQNYKFWAGIADEEASAYNASGVKNGKGRSSLFQVRA